MAAVRCKQSKLSFFFGALYGKKWREDELFYPQALVQDRADRLLQRYNTSSQVGAVCSVGTMSSIRKAVSRSQ